MINFSDRLSCLIKRFAQEKKPTGQEIYREFESYYSNLHKTEKLSQIHGNTHS